MRIKRKTIKAQTMCRREYKHWSFHVWPSLVIERNDMLADEKWYYIMLSWLMFQVYFGIGVKKGGDEHEL